MNIRKAKSVAIIAALITSVVGGLIGVLYFGIASAEADDKAEATKYCASDKMVKSFYIDGNHPPRAAVCQDSMGGLRVVIEK